MIIIVNNYISEGSVTISHLLSMWKCVMVADVDTALKIARTAKDVELIILSGSELDPAPKKVWLAFTTLKIPVIAICYSMQCIAASIDGKSCLKKMTDVDLRRIHAIDGVGKVKSNHKWGVVRPPAGSTDIKWYRHSDQDVVAEFRYRNVRAYQYHPELLAETRDRVFGEFRIRNR